MGKAMHELREMLDVELDKITRSGDLTASKLDLVDKLTHSIKSIDTIMAMQEYSDDDDYSYNDGYSNARGRRGNVKRDSMGRYAREGRGYSYRDRGGYSRRGYSRDDGAKEEAMQKLQELMNETSDSNVRIAIQNAMNEMQ